MDKTNWASFDEVMTYKEMITLYEKHYKLKIRVSGILAGNESAMNFLRSFPEKFNQIGIPVYQARNELRMIDCSGWNIEGLGRVMLKRFHTPFCLQKLVYSYIRQPKCRKAYNNTEELRRRGFKAARELATVEVWRHGLYQYAFFVSEVGIGQRLDDLVMTLRKNGNEQRWVQLIKEYAGFVKRLHEHGVLYWDLNCGNVLCQQDERSGKWQFTLIDTNRVRFYSSDSVLPLNVVIGDLILMNPRMGTVELFIAEYLKQRGIYSENEVKRIREVQRNRYERKRPLKSFLKFLKHKK